jgi:DNA polymerase IIIc chi subunit
MEQKNEINDLKTRLAKLEAIINSSLIVDGITNKEEILKYRRERYRTMHKKGFKLFSEYRDFYFVF